MGHNACIMVLDADGALGGLPDSDRPGAGGFLGSRAAMKPIHSHENGDGTKTVGCECNKPDEIRLTSMFGPAPLPDDFEIVPRSFKCRPEGGWKWLVRAKADLEPRRGFTLVELLVVIVIIAIVSAAALPTILPAISHRQVSEGARTLQAALAGAQSAATNSNAPSGIRLIPDPAFSGVGPAKLADGTDNPYAGIYDPSQPIAYNRIVPLSPAPRYSEGLVSTYNTPNTQPYIAAMFFAGPTNALVLEESPGQWVQGSTGAWVYQPNPPTSWWGNIRVGDQVQPGNAGNWYTVIGPLATTAAAGNPELFTGAGVTNPWSRDVFAPDGTKATIAPEYLLLVNGQDDNQNGLIDEEWDGLDNDNANGIDDKGEWGEVETWQGSIPTSWPTSIPYTIRRRPMPAQGGRATLLPSDVVIDGTGITGAKGRSRVPASTFNQFTGTIDIMLASDGSVIPTTLYSTPASVGMDGSFYHFWIAERGDIWNPVQAPKGEWRLVTLFARTGRVTTTESPDLTSPFIAVEQGSR